MSENPIDRALRAGDYENAETGENPFQNYTTLTGFEAQAWFDFPNVTPANIVLPEVEENPTSKANVTIYDIVRTSRYTSKLHKLIDDYPTIASYLKSTEANYTLFAPVDASFEKLHKDTSKNLLESVLKTHIASYTYPADFLLISPNVPTLLESNTINGEPRTHFGIDQKGLALNYYSHVIAFSISATNGVIHVVDSLVLPPPPALKILELLPAEFSTLELGLKKSGLWKVIEEDGHVGITFFAPTNHAFQKLDPKVNAFLFGDEGVKYLRVLLSHHVVLNSTLYSNAFYEEGKPSRYPAPWPHAPHKDIVFSGKAGPKGYREFQLPTMLQGEDITVGINRDGKAIDLRVDGFSLRAVDGVAEDGVVHAVGDILLPKRGSGDVLRSDDLTVGSLRKLLDGYC